MIWGFGTDWYLWTGTLGLWVVLLDIQDWSWDWFRKIWDWGFLKIIPTGASRKKLASR